MVNNHFSYFDPNIPIDTYSGSPPHWSQAGRTYFISFRLADSLPQIKLHQWRQERERWLRAHPEPHDEHTRQEYYRHFPERFHQWLDTRHGSCLLKEEGNRAIVVNALMFFDGRRYMLDAWAAMPNHVHAIVAPFKCYPLFGIIQSWKAFTAREINRRMGRSGEVRQRESYDHIIRNIDAHERIRKYIGNNPASLPDGTYSLWSEETIV